jgi:hypothetical protein
MDIKTLMKVEAIGNYAYFLILVDDYSGLIKLFPLTELPYLHVLFLDARC